jgi:predicted PurR-regulated permease PerM
VPLDPEDQNERHGSGFTFRRFLVMLAIAALLSIAYLLRGVLAPLFLAFLVAYALDPLVDRLEALRVPRALAAVAVLLGIVVLMSTVMFFAIPMFLDELGDVGAALPSQLASLEARIEPWLWSTFKLKVPHSLAELMKAYGDRVQAQMPTVLNAGAVAVFGTLSYVAVAFSALIIPVFALYLLIDFDRIVTRSKQLLPRRWIRPVSQLASQVHSTLGGYVRGQITANIVLAALYAAGLRLVDIRLAVPIGVLTGLLAFVPYVGFFIGMFLGVAMATLDWHGIAPILGVVAVMGTVQLLDALVITPRIVGRSVGLAPLEVLLTMSAAASLLGFMGILLAVPLGAVIKILLTRATTAYLTSDFYARPPPRKSMGSSSGGRLP